MRPETETNQAEPASRLRIPRQVFLLIGFVNVGLGIAGAVLPLMPATVFFLIALWAFSNSSPRFHDWLYSHPRYGPTLQAWKRDRAIPIPAKLLAVTMMSVSITWLAFFSDTPPMVIAAVALGLGGLACWIVTRPSPIAVEGTE